MHDEVLKALAELHDGEKKVHDHQKLAECLNQTGAARWVLTYDNVSQVGDLYADRRRRLFSLSYSAHRVTKAQEVMIFSDSLMIPAGIETEHAELTRASPLQPHPPRRVPPEELAVADVAADHLDGAVAGLGHDFALFDAVGGRLGGQAGAQGVAGQALGVQAGG